METEDEETSLISTPSTLPEDVLLEVFDFLRTRDRNNAKLVCKLWFRILSRPYFTQIEAFLFPNYYDFPTTSKLVDELGRDELNLRFQRRWFQLSSEIIWKKCGLKIKSLQFYRCSFNPAVVSQIFQHCINLEEFVAVDCEVVLPHRRIHRTVWQLRTNLLREKLVTLKFGCLPLNASDLSYVASTFPKLKTLEISSKKNANMYISTLLNLFQTQMLDVEELHLHLSHSGSSPENLCSLQTFITSIRKMEVTVSLEVSPELQPRYLAEDHFRSISSYKFVRSLVLTDDPDERPKPIYMTLVTRFVDEVSTLDELEFSLFVTTVPDVCTIWSSLIKSHLLRLKIICTNYALSDFLSDSVAEIDSLLDSLPRNNTVRDLRVRNSESLNFLFAKYFQGVLDLNMTEGEAAIILKYQTQLRSLCLNVDCSRYTNLSQISIESLEFISTTDLVDKLFLHYRFPNLRYLVVLLLENDQKEKEEVLQTKNSGRKTCRDLLNDNLPNLVSTLPCESPKLEGVEYFICGEIESLDCFFQFCSKFHNLRCIHLRCGVYSNREEPDLRREITRYFSSRSSSVEIVWITTYRFEICYFFNAVENKYEFFDFNRQRRRSYYYHNFFPRMTFDKV